MDNINRRTFMGATAGMLAPAVVTRGFGQANNRVRVACVGIRGQGKAHIRAYTEMPGVEIAALCDVDESVLAERMKELAAHNIKPATFTDVRKVLEDKSIDAVSFATPNHWHALGTIWACQAGKDVYVEKPASHNIWEGRKMVEAARKYNRIVQHGSNSRSSPAIREAFQKLRDGLIGDVYMARGLCYKWRDTIGRKSEEAVPAGVHYDLWTGPAAKRPFTQNRFHYNWHWNWEYGNGDIGNQGIHQMDIARWGLGVKFPTRVQSLGGHFMFDDDQETPNTQVATMEFHDTGKKTLLVFEVRHWMTNSEAGIGEGESDRNVIGNIFYGSKGYMTVSGRGYRTYLGRERAPGPSGQDAGNHWANFIQAVRSRKVEDLHADIEEGHRSSVLMHLANISYRTGRSIDFDPATEKIVGDSEAAKLMTRKYRAPFVVPEKV